MYELIFGFFNKLISLCDVVYNFLFTTINVAGVDISMWQLVGGVAFATFITLWLVKKLVPAV